MTRSMQLVGATRKWNDIWTAASLWVVCAHMASSDMHQREAITVAVFHTGIGIQMKMSLLICNCSVTDPKAELSFKSHLAKRFAVKIVISVSSSGTSYLCAFFSVCVWVWV